MYEYKYVPVEREGWIFSGFDSYRDVIEEESAKGWRYTGWFPVEITNGALTRVELIFEREA